MTPAPGCPLGDSRPAATALLRLRPTVEILDDGGGFVHLVLPGVRPDLEFEATPLAQRVLACLDGSHTTEQIIATAAGTKEQALEARAALHELWACSALEDSRDVEQLGPDEIDRLDRQLRYLRDLSEPGDPVLLRHRRLRAAHVVILGVGGLGSWSALCLAAAGAGRLTLIDDDRVERSNLARQALFAARDVGRKKVDAASEALGRLHPDADVAGVDARIRSSADLAVHLQGADIVVSTADWPSGVIDAWVDEACQATGTPSMTVGQHPPHIRIGPLLVPGVTACHRCRVRQLEAMYPNYGRLAQLRSTSSSQAATFAGTSAILGGWASTEVVHHLTGVPTACLGRAHIVDIRTFGTHAEYWISQDDCGCVRG